MSANQSVVVFDGVCHLCNGWVQFLLRRDKAERFVFAPMQTETGRRLLRQHGLDPDSPVSFLLLEEGVAYTDSIAILRVLRQLGPFWKAIAVVLAAVPRLLRDPAYRFVARHRYRLFGRRAECMIPAPEDARRFIR
ncbi:MAG: thiol-disulfide oxidoreductase DCC family protein [Sulfurifustis sp.]